MILSSDHLHSNLQRHMHRKRATKKIAVPINQPTPAQAGDYRDPKKQTSGVNSVTDFCPKGFLNHITSDLPTYLASFTSLPFPE